MSINLKSLLDSAGVRKASVARMLGVNKSTLTRWEDRGVPADRVVDLERVTGIPRQAIRPDLYIGLHVALSPERAA